MTADRLEHLPLAELVPYARNSRTHSPEQVGQLAASIREFGFTNPILIDEAGGIIAGHGRVMAAQSIGLDRVPCLRLTHLTDAQKRAYVIADNKLALNAGWDQDVLAAEIRALQLLEFDIGLTGFGDKELGELFAALDLSPEGGTGGQDPEAALPVPATPVSRLGDVWTLGRHRVICGDSTDLATYARLMGGGYG
jgi:ParB-like chromosome segregation protein Spo0J